MSCVTKEQLQGGRKVEMGDAQEVGGVGRDKGKQK